MTVQLPIRKSCLYFPRQNKTENVIFHIKKKIKIKKYNIIPDISNEKGKRTADPSLHEYVLNIYPDSRQLNLTSSVSFPMIQLSTREQNDTEINTYRSLYGLQQ